MMMKQSIPLTRNLDVADVNIFKEFYIEQSRRVSHLTVTQERTAQFYRMLIDHSLHLGKPLERRCLFYSCSHGICPFWTQVFYAQDFFYQTPVDFPTALLSATLRIVFPDFASAITLVAKGGVNKAPSLPGSESELLSILR